MTMLERFTEAARASVKDAWKIAADAGSPGVGEEHLLGALLAQPDCTAVAALTGLGLGPDQHRALLDECRDFRRRGGIGRADAEALRGLGIEVDEIIDRVEQIWGEGALLEPVAAQATGRGRWKRGTPAASSGPGRLPWRPESKRVLETALRQALDLGSKRVGSEHLLLGLLIREGVVREVLTARGITALRVRALIPPNAEPSA
jgi:ATP-dependent Clp protease ATP-binding subunit ClpA